MYLSHSRFIDMAERLLSSFNQSTCPVGPWWPGNNHINWICLDCYYVYPTGTFISIFRSTIREIRSLTSKPIFIAETAVGLAAGPRKIEDLFSGASNTGLIGLPWFDETQHGGLYHEDWRLEDNAAALAAFKASARQWGHGRYHVDVSHRN